MRSCRSPSSSCSARCRRRLRPALGSRPLADRHTRADRRVAAARGDRYARTIGQRAVCRFVLAVAFVALTAAGCGGGGAKTSSQSGTQLFRAFVNQLDGVTTRASAEAALVARPSILDEFLLAAQRRREQIYSQAFCAGANYITDYVAREGAMPNGSVEWQAWWQEFARAELTPLYDELPAESADWVVGRLADTLYSQTHPLESMNICFVLKQL
jgi:hypothetical protein